MNNTKEFFKVGLVIADIDEYVHIEEMFGNLLKRQDVATIYGHIFNIEAATKTIEVHSVCSGIGKVNAASAAALLAKDCDLIISAGLSGGFSSADKLDLVVGTKFIEHDFDLTAIGYEVSVKPGDEGILVAHEEYTKDILTKFNYVKEGTFVTGDSFISSAEKHDELCKLFNPIACDMESAAVAHSAKLFNIPFVSIRMVSDGANDSSADTYTDTLKGDKADGWAALVFAWLKTL